MIPILPARDALAGFFTAGASRRTMPSVARAIAMGFHSCGCRTSPVLTLEPRPSGPYDPVVQLSTPLARLSVMEGRTLAIATYNTKLDDNFAIATTDAAERARVEKGIRDVEARIERDMDPYVAARQGDTDEIVALGELRDSLAVLVEAGYQSIGHRRMKNPRIWSMRDIAELSRGRRGAAKAERTADHYAHAPAPAAQRLADSALVFRAPSAGRFYCRSAPDREPFVKAGDEILRGQVVGLLAIMKTFSRTTYGGPGLPERARVKAILPEDAADVAMGDPILLLE